MGDFYVWERLDYSDRAKKIGEFDTFQEAKIFADEQADGKHYRMLYYVLGSSMMWWATPDYEARGTGE